MFKDTKAFSSFSTNDLAAAKQFYDQTLGLEVTEVPAMSLLDVHLAHGGEVMIYSKDDHIPASFTVLNFSVENIDAAVEELAGHGVKFESYDGAIKTDEKGISRAEGGPFVAWFKDPAGNILAVLQEKQ